MDQGSVRTLRYGGVELVLHAQRCAWHADSRSLFVADVHLGKETSYQRASLPVPQGSTQQALDRLTRLVVHYQPDHVVVLGDLIHASSSFAESFRRRMNEFWRQQEASLPKCKWTLVEGNHDLRAKQQMLDWPITIVPPAWPIGEMLCIHDPDDDSLFETSRLVLAGHLHPSYRMPDNGEKLNCFALRGNVLIFPAFNEFTGRRTIDAQNLDSVFVIRDQQLARIDL